MDVPKTNKRRKITDKSVPQSLLNNPAFAEDSKMYQDLAEMERRLDWTVSRKKVEVQDALGRTMTINRTLRLFLSHTVSGQTWQTGVDAPTPNFETGEGIPAWQFKLEGRLLEIPGVKSKHQPPPRKFTTFIKHLIIELERDPSVYPDGNIVEWHRQANNVNNPQAQLDGFTIRRTGDQPTRIRVVLHLTQEPEVFKVHPELGDILGIKEESRVGVLQTLWNYIKIQGLQDKVDRRMIRADDKLKPIFGADTVPFQQLPEIAMRFLLPADPIILHYTLNPSVLPPEKPQAWDVEVKTDDVGLKSRMNHVLVGLSTESAKDLQKLDDEIALHAQSLHNSHIKRTFLHQFARDPAAFIQRWIESQSKDLESMLGSGPTEGSTAYDMASKQLGKLRQWAGEVISSREKTVATDEFKELEHDVELRRESLMRLHIAAEDFKHSLAKKKDSDAMDAGEKITRIDALGIVMIKNGEEYGEESGYGSALIKLGRAHCKIATLQEAFALTLQDTFLSAMQRYGEDIKAYDVQRKKLDSRRLSYDAAVSKVEHLKKNKKTKEKDLQDAEEELEMAKQRFEETSEDVHARMYAIQENELSQLKDLGSFLDAELSFVNQYAEILRDVKSDWVDEHDLSKRPRPHGPTHSFTREEDDLKRFGSVKSTKSTRHRSTPPSDAETESDNADVGRKSVSRKPSMARRKSNMSMKSRQSEKEKDESRSHSRTPSKSGRKRTDSSATANGNSSTAQAEHEAASSKRRSIAGWMSSIGRTKAKDSFSTLQGQHPDDASEDEDEDEAPKRPPSSLSNKSSKSAKSKSKTSDSPRIASRSLLQKRVKALYDFSGSSDELSFRVGDEIVVLNEVLEEWWMGEMDGKTGLFPSTYTEVIQAPTSSKAPPLPRRPRASSRPPTLASTPRFNATHPADTDSYLTSDADDDHPFGDHMLVSHARTPVYNTFGDADSALSSAAEDGEEEERGLMKKHDSPWAESESTISRKTPAPRIPLRRGTEVGSSNSLGKKAPPPPPPRRANSSFQSSASSLSATSQEKRSNTFLTSHSSASTSSQSSLSALAAATSGGHAESPFGETVGSWSGPCKDFKQNPFKPRGMCSNCFQMHE
ncbi:BAR-domain-containing protein [Punctularia strigosozonata HHB-11173 SS5]|uniref:BAR-domain-containing protein n=1 Tax=Punctularia strigosozonata (strain HHB-11173) TaxID=741275 RepID=UPI0004417043|nr:BAR-domain-containing protein [Punctularia strigosozonata HHB-11173 SS5]EIN05710.1 BAR-domain-containing protein [Punctularia strigosozonata HHB-11173 SS5]